MTPQQVPYRELPAAEHGGRRGWASQDPPDQIGRPGLISPRAIADAAGLVHRGAAFRLDVPVGTFDPPLNPARKAPRHTVIEQSVGIGLDDRWDDFFPQSGSQWDSLAHIGMTRSTYYGGATHQEVRGGERNGIHHWARRGLVGRAVLLDMPAVFAAAGRPHEPTAPIGYGPDDIEAARRRAGVEWHAGDIALLHTGFTAWYCEQLDAVRQALPGKVSTPGLAHTEDMCAYLWDCQIAAIAGDNVAVESWPADTSPERQPFGFLHQVLIGSFGMALGELFWLHDLALDSRATGVSTGLLVAAPINAAGAISSPANAVVLR